MAHGHDPRKEYLIILILLTVLTAAEVGITYIDIGQWSMGSFLVAMAIGKAALVGLYYMHLKTESRALQLVVAIPLTLPFLYAIFLITEAFWRFWSSGGKISADIWS